MSSMTIQLTRILEQMEKRGISKKEMCAKLGYKGQQAFASWMKDDGKNTSYIKKIPQMAEILGVSADSKPPDLAEAQPDIRSEH